MDTHQDMSGVLLPMDAARAAMCWWCGAVADSREHKIKASDLRRLQGAGQTLYWGEGVADPRPIPHVKVRDVKFPKSLCKKCNELRSRKMDAAYDMFTEYTWTQAADLRYRTFIDLKDIFDPLIARKSGRRIVQYFAKHMGCRIHELGYEVPKEIPEFLDGAESMPHVDIHFYRDIAAYKSWVRRKELGDHSRGMFIGMLSVRKVDESDCHSPVSAFAGEILIGTVGFLFVWAADYSADKSQCVGDEINLGKRTDFSLDELRAEWPKYLLDE